MQAGWAATSGEGGGEVDALVRRLHLHTLDVSTPPTLRIENNRPCAQTPPAHATHTLDCQHTPTP